MLDYWLMGKRVVGILTSLYLISSGQAIIPEVAYVETDEIIFCDSGDIQIVDHEIVEVETITNEEPLPTPSPSPDAYIDKPKDDQALNDADGGGSDENPQQNQESQPQPTQVPAPTDVPPTPAVHAAQSTGVDVSGAVNAYRNSKGLNSLQSRGDVCDVAKKRAGEAVGSFGHSGFEEAVASLDYSGVAENLWQGSSISADQIIEGWDQSPGHQQNMTGEWVWGCGAISGTTAAFIFMR